MMQPNCYHCETCLTPHFSLLSAACPYCQSRAIVLVLDSGIGAGIDTKCPNSTQNVDNNLLAGEPSLGYPQAPVAFAG